MARSPGVPALLGAGTVALAMLVAGLLAVARAPAPTEDGPAAVVVADTGPATPSASGFYVDPRTAAAAELRELRAAGRTADADLIAKIAEQPVPLWVTGDVGAVTAEVRDYVGRAAAAGQRPLLVAYDIPGRDCGSYSGGGATGAVQYRTWMSNLIAGLGGRPATVVVEPDAVAQAVSGCVDRSLIAQREALLTEAIGALKAAGATVYLDAGNPGFVTDTAALAAALRRSGVAKADGFALNVSNFHPTAEVIAYGTRLSDILGGAHFVVDTSRNGLGGVASEKVDGAPSFCNPPGRGLGVAPTTRTDNPRVDALLWIKRPGESDGNCRTGEPTAGQWYADYALGLARRATGS